MTQPTAPALRRRGAAPHDVVAALALGLVPLAGSAATPPGQLLASQCAQCHGTNGQAVSGFESIRGKSASDMYKTLVEMKNRPAENIMDRQARGYTDAQLRLIAEYLAKLPTTASALPEK
ncbi:MAG: c-type cytochrome [Verrucomicrobia bacterium]|nr:c-type cytochrome [Verrucomicrobiota bacterium]